MRSAGRHKCVFKRLLGVKLWLPICPIALYSYESKTPSSLSWNFPQNVGVKIFAFSIIYIYIYIERVISVVLPSHSPAALREVPSFETLSAEMESLKRHLSQIDSPTVLCHNDLLTKNIIYNHNEGEEQQCTSQTLENTPDVTLNTDKNKNLLFICSSAIEEYVAEAN